MTGADVFRRWIDAMNRKDAAAFAELYAPNAIVRDPAYPQPLEGRAAIRSDAETFFRTLPDLVVQVSSLLEQDGTLAVEGTFEGTHEGPLVNGDVQIPATGRRLTFNAAGFYRLDGQGRILEERRYYDIAGMLAQIGAPAQGVPQGLHA